MGGRGDKRASDGLQDSGYVRLFGEKIYMMNVLVLRSLHDVVYTRLVPTVKFQSLEVLGFRGHVQQRRPDALQNFSNSETLLLALLLRVNPDLLSGRVYLIG